MKKKIKICYITTIPGTVNFFVQQLKYLSDKGLQVYVICSHSDKLQDELGENIKYIPVSITRGIAPQSLLKSIWQLICVFKKEKFDIVQYSTPNAAFVSAIAAWFSGIKVRNYHLMGLRYISEHGLKRSVLKFLEYITCLFSTHIECISHSNLKLSVKEGLFPEKKATIIWNGSSGGVNMQRFNPINRVAWKKKIRGQLKINEDEFVFGFAGRITRDKGINEILSAFRTLEDRCRLLLIGKQEGIDTLNKELWEYAKNSENIIIVDRVDNIECYYAAMDILLLPSYREGFGMVIAEAAAVGTPAIVTNIPGPIDVISENETALTVEKGNIEDLTEKMVYLLNDRTKVQEMANCCFEFIKEKFDSTILNEKILERKMELIESVENNE